MRLKRKANQKCISTATYEMNGALPTANGWQCYCSDMKSTVSLQKADSVIKVSEYTCSKAFERQGSGLVMYQLMTTL